jgi:hypothetical protein
MNSQTTGLRVAALIFGFVAIGHAVRLYTKSIVIVGHFHVPMVVSWVGLVIAGALCIWLLTLSSTSRG